MWRGISHAASIAHAARGRVVDIAGIVSQISAGRWIRHDRRRGAMLVAEYNSAGTMLRRYVPGQGVDETLVWYEGTDLSTPHWLHTDQQGSVIATTDSSGAATPHAYSVTGEPKGGWSASAPAFRYTGQVAIASAAIYYYKARMYDPALGRFLQTDPVGYQAGMNLYAYVGNDSMNATDASGLCADPENSTVDCTDQVESVTDTGIRSWNDTLLTDLARITDRALQSPIFRFSIDEKQRQSIANGTNNNPSNNNPQKPNDPQCRPWQLGPCKSNPKLDPAIKFVCKSNPGLRILGSVAFGAGRGAVVGGYLGFTAGEIFGGEVTLGATGVPGALLGGAVGGTVGGASGLVSGIGLAEACYLAGAYGGS
jgi:RHS repeat-associated protein